MSTISLGSHTEEAYSTEGRTSDMYVMASFVDGSPQSNVLLIVTPKYFAISRAVMIDYKAGSRIGWLFSFER